MSLTAVDASLSRSPTFSKKEKVEKRRKMCESEDGGRGKEIRNEMISRK